MAHRRWVSWCGAAAITAACVAAVVAQDRGGVPTDGSLAALTAEVRQLREAVQDFSRNQAQAQALTAYLTVQHTRVTQATSRVDGARSELESLTVRARELTSSLASINQSLGREVDPARRAELEEAARQVRLEQASVAYREQQARSREIDLAQALQLEEARWTDLTARMEQLVNPR